MEKGRRDKHQTPWATFRHGFAGILEPYSCALWVNLPLQHSCDSSDPESGALEKKKKKGIQNLREICAF